MSDLTSEGVKQALEAFWPIASEVVGRWAERTPIMPYACERCDLGYESWQVECDDCGGPVEERQPPDNVPRSYSVDQPGNTE